MNATPSAADHERIERQLAGDLGLYVPPEDHPLVAAGDLTPGMVVRVPRSRTERTVSFVLPVRRIPRCGACGAQLDLTGPPGTWGHTEPPQRTHQPILRADDLGRWVIIFWEGGGQVPVEASRLVEVVPPPAEEDSFNENGNDADGQAA